MDKSRVYQSEQEYTCGIAKASLNIFNGRLLYDYPLVSIGSGNFQIDASIVYNSQYQPTDFNGRKIGFGNGWKYNFEQFLMEYRKEYQIEGFEDKDYIYIDSEWKIHRFVRYQKSVGYSENENAYYDESGTGLKLVIRTASHPKIFDEYGNTYIFHQGKLVTFISGVHAGIQKNIEYDENSRVTSVYDARKATKKIQFEYNQEGLPIKIYTTHQHIFYTFEYKNTLLSKILIHNASQQKPVHELKYNANNGIEYAINTENLLALKFEYIIKENLPLVKKVFTGAMQKNTIAETDQTEVYCGENRYVGENKYISNTYETYRGTTLTMPSNYIQSTMTYDYQVSYTEEKSDKEIAIRHYFDMDGRHISSLENGDEFKHYTTSRTTGWEISTDGQSDITLNGKKAMALTKNQQQYTLTIHNESLTTFKNIFDVDSDHDGIVDEAYSEHFHISFWMMFTNANDSNRIAKLNYQVNGENKEEQVVIQNTRGMSWQQVSIPIHLGTTQKTLSNMQISIGVDTQLNVSNHQVLIADVRIYKGNVQSICIDHSKKDNPSYMELKIGNSLYYYDDSEKSVQLSAQFYMTENDIIATYRSLFYSIKNNQKYYDLFYCNKTKVKSVYYVSPISPNHIDFKYYKFTFGEENGHDIIHNGVPNYHFRMIDLVAIYEEAKAYRVTEIQRSVHERGNNRYYFETKTAIGFVSDLDAHQRLKEDKATCSYVSENDDGKKRYQKYTKKITNNSGELVKEVKIKSENHYDEYGNLLSIETYEEDHNNDERLCKEFNYDSNEPMNREHITSIKENGSILEYTYHNDESIHSVISKYNQVFEDTKIQVLETPVTTQKMCYIYDDFGYLEKVQYFNQNNQLIGENTIQYNQQGNMNHLKDLSDASYGFTYNAFSEQAAVYRNKHLLQRQKNITGKKTNTSMSYIYQGPTTFVNTSQYNQYGMILSSSTGKLSNEEIINKKTIQFTYEDSSEYSPSLSRIQQIYDPYTNQTYVYTYDDHISNGTTKTQTESNTHFSITTKPNGTKIYDMQSDGAQIKYTTEQEDQMNGNPKLSYNYTKNKTSNDWQENIYYSYDYEYDNLGRLVCKKGKEDQYTNATIQTNKEIDYYHHTSFPKEIRYKVDSKLNDGTQNSAVLTYQSAYQNAHITQIKESGTRFIHNPKNSDSQEKAVIVESITKYEYDDCNRLIKEIRPNGDVFEYSYGQTSGMIEEVKKNKTIIQSFKYHSGKLTNITNHGIMTNIEYDNYGNITQTHLASITYNDRNLMESYRMSDNEIYTFDYNYQGIRYKKQKGAEYTVNYYLDGSRIIGEDVVDTHQQIIRKFRYFYDAGGICGINYIIGNDNHYFNLIKDPLGNISKVMYRGKIIGEYIYDGWGNCEIKELSISNDIDRCVLYQNPFRYKGYYLDTETQLFYCNSRYYSPELCRWISPDSIEYLESSSINGLNLYCYCMNNPIMYADPSGHFVITLSTILWAVAIGAAIGAGIGLGATIVKDLENGKLFDGDVTLLSYVGNTLGGAVAGAGIGLCSVLGVGLGVALSTGTALTIGGTVISGGAALVMGVGGAFITGGLGYAVRTGISDQEEFEWSDMFIEAGANAISGMLTFTGAMVGGIMGVKVPGAKFSFKNFALYHLGATYFGVYPIKIILAYIKKKLKERY